jgi:cytochrome c oxidase subunit 2
MCKMFFYSVLFINLYLYLNVSPLFLDYAHNWEISFQDPASPIMEGIIALHHDIMFILSIIGFFVTWLLYRILYLYFHKNNQVASMLTHGTFIEVIWTITPSLILMVIAIPSFALLYSVDEVLDPAVTFKVIGHQWYWSYEYSDFCNKDGESIVFDSYMLNDDDLVEGQLRLLEVDNRVVLPIKTHIRALVTSVDVIHSWAVPSLGIKMDACPGRLNQVSIYITREGTFFGQCSEICGIQHGFMPIVVQGVSVNNFIIWVNSQTECENWLVSKSKSLNNF